MTEISHRILPSEPEGQMQSTETALQALLDILITGNPPADLPESLLENARFIELESNLINLQQFILALSNGDLSKTLKMKGSLAGSLKNLQSSLLHLTWQAKMISQGDFSQRVDFMGEFSTEFNNMVINLAEARSKLQQRETELVSVNADLVQEITERKRVEVVLQQINNQLQIHIKEIEALHKQLQEQAIHDALTGLFNRGYLQKTLEREIARAHRASQTVTIIMMDIDKFKAINDSYGHKAGDIMLQEMGKLLKSCTRTDDIACRYGGEEFVLVMPGASQKIAEERAEFIRVSFDALHIPHENHELHTTLSLGVANYPSHGESGEAVLVCADRALYQAKQSGRNRVILFHLS